MAEIGEVSVRITADTARFDAAMGGISQRLARVGSSLTNVGTQLTLKVTAPLALVGTQALRTAGDFQTAMNRVRALTGATGDSFEMLQSQALELGRTTQFMAKDAADAMGFMSMAGFQANQIFSALPSTLTLAASAQLDMASSADIVTNIMAGFGQQVEELPRSVDVLVKAFTSANTNLSQLAQALKFVGPVAKGSGIAFEETTASLALMGNAGLQATLAGTGLRGILTKLAKPSKEAAEALMRLGVNAKNDRGELLPLISILKQFEVGVQAAGGEAAVAGDMMTIFGQRAGPAMQALLTQGSAALADLTEKLMNSGGIAQRIADVQMEGYAGAMKRLISSMEGLQISIGQALVPAFLKFSDLMVRTNTVLINMDSSTRNLFLAIAGIGVVIGPVLLAFGLLIKFITPFNLLAAAIIAIGAAGVFLWKNWAELGPRLSRIWDGLGKDFTRFLENSYGPDGARRIIDFGNLVSSTFSMIMTVGKTLFNFIGTTLGSAWDAVGAIWRGDLDALQSIIENWVSQALVPVVNGIGSMIDGFITRVWSGVSAVWDLDLETLRGLVESWWTVLRPIGSALKMMVETTATTLWKNLPEDWQRDLDRSKRAIQEWWSDLTGLIELMPTFLETTFATIWEVAAGVWEGDLGRLKQAVDTWAQVTQPILLRVYDLIGSTIKFAWSTIPQEWQTAISPLPDIVEKLWGEIRAVFADPGTTLAKVVAQWIHDGVAAVGEAAPELGHRFKILGVELLRNLWEGLKSLDFTDLLTSLIPGQETLRLLFPLAAFGADVRKEFDKLQGLEATPTIKPKLITPAQQELDRKLQELTSSIESTTSPTVHLSLAPLEIPPVEVEVIPKLGDSDLFRRGISFPGEQPEILADGTARAFEKNIRAATDFQIVLENVTLDLEGLKGLMFEMEQFNPLAALSQKDQRLFVQANPEEYLEIIQNFRAMGTAVDEVMEKLSGSTDKHIQSMLQQIIQRFLYLNRVLVGASIVPDMADAIIDVWTGMLSEMVGSTTASSKALSQEFQFGDALIQPLEETRREMAGFSSEIQRFGSLFPERSADFNQLGQAARLFGQDFREMAQSTKTEGFNLFTSLKDGFIELMGAESQALPEILGLLDQVQNIFSGLDAPGAEEITALIGQIQQALKDVGDITAPATSGVIEFNKTLKDLNESFHEIQASSNVLGASYDKVGARVRAMENALIQLQKIQMDGAQLTNHQIQQMEDLQAALSIERETQFMTDSIRDIGNAFTGNIREMVRGVQRGTLSIGQLFENMVDNIILSLTSQALEKAIQSLIDMLIQVIVRAMEAEQAAKQAAAFAGGGGVGGGLVGSLFNIGLTAAGAYFGGGGFTSPGFGAGLDLSSTLPGLSAAGTSLPVGLSGLDTGGGAGFSGLGSQGLQAARFNFFAEGGTMAPGEMGIVGEHGWELIEGGMHGKSITPLDPSMFAPPKFEVNITNYTGEPVKQSARRNESGGRSLDVIIGEAVKRDANNGGPGIRAIQRVLGTSRVGGQR